MYEPIRTPPSRKGSVHSTTAGTTSDPDFPHRSREEELDIQLAGHLGALLAVTDELRGAAPSEELDTAAERLATQVARLRGGVTPVRMAAAPSDDLMALHERAHALAGRALVVAASRADTAAAILAAEQMDVHAAALEPRELTSR
ncbi:SCO4983 family protein [Streptomyces sp. NPDC001537]